jgi:hypothetical protein
VDVATRGAGKGSASGTGMSEFRAAVQWARSPGRGGGAKAALGRASGPCRSRCSVAATERESEAVGVEI